jgi:hypothetical protein
MKLFDTWLAQGYELTFRAPKDEKPAVVEHDVPAFSHIIILASESKSEPFVGATGHEFILVVQTSAKISHRSPSLSFCPAAQT